jgi:hypothetical protein
MNINRVPFRNIHFIEDSTGRTLGGLRQNGSVTEANFLWILAHILIVGGAPFSVSHRETGRAISSTNNPLELGTYHIHCNGKSPSWPEFQSQSY